MHNNHYFLKHLTREIANEIVGLRLSECYSQNKDELMMVFSESSRVFIIRAILGAQFSCLAFPNEATRAKKNSVSLFGNLIGKQVKEVELFANDRSFCVFFESQHQFVFKMHGNRANILHFCENTLIEIFNSQLRKDETLHPDKLSKNIDQSIDAWLSNPNLHQLFPALGKELKAFLDHRNYEMLEPYHQWQLITQTLNRIENAKFHIIIDNGKPTLTLLPTDQNLYSTPSAIKACNELVRLYQQVYMLESEKIALIKKLNLKIQSTQNYILKAEEKLQELNTRRSFAEIGDVIMANLATIPKGTTSTSLFNFYTNEPIDVKIPAGQSPQKVAENFYRKSKNQSLETEALASNIKSKRNEFIKLSKFLEEVLPLQSIKAIRKYAATIQPNLATQEDSTNLPYFEHVIEGYRVLIGKNAKANDELLRLHTSKNDLWLHARNTPGSHVIIKEIKNRPFPNHTIEKAAMLAAYYSKSKQDSLCPVIYTPRKYVRKAKHLAPGQVLVEKEKVVIVPPKSEV